MISRRQVRRKPLASSVCPQDAIIESTDAIIIPQLPQYFRNQGNTTISVQQTTYIYREADIDSQVEAAAYDSREPPLKHLVDHHLHLTIPRATE